MFPRLQKDHRMSRQRSLFKNTQHFYPEVTRTLVLICTLLLVACTQQTLETQNIAIDSNVTTSGVSQKQSTGTRNNTHSQTANVIQAILATTDLSIGKQRVGFILISRLGDVMVPKVTVTSQALFGSQNLSQTVEAKFKLWPNINRGLYVTEIDFPKPGDWRLNMRIAWPDGTTKTSHLLLEIEEQSIAPMVGTFAIRSITKTIHTTPNLTELTSGRLQDPDFYQITLADALQNSRPTIVVFTSPAFCTGPFCGPQLEILRDLKFKFMNQVDFIHVDYYQNPDLILGNLDKAIISKAALEWSLPDTQWTFVIDDRGIITHRYQGFVNSEELHQSLQETVGSSISLG